MKTNETLHAEKDFVNYFSGEKCLAACSQGDYTQRVFLLRSINNKPLVCSLLDIEGRIVYTESIKATNNTYNFNFSAVSKGLYTLRVVNENEVLNLKLVIK